MVVLASSLLSSIAIEISYYLVGYDVENEYFLSSDNHLVYEKAIRLNEWRVSILVKSKEDDDILVEKNASGDFLYFFFDGRQSFETSG